jgi:AraC-like DNA-binding protein
MRAGSQSQVLGLIQRAVSLLEQDRSEAWRCLRDAYTLLGQETAHEPTAEHLVQPVRSRHCGGLAAWQVRRIVDFIEARVGAKLTIEEIAAAIGLSKSHFSRAFKSTLGTSPMAYVASRRIERAKRMMVASAESLADVALNCGFADQSHLNRQFRRTVGMTPGQWRRSSERAPSTMQSDGRSGSSHAHQWRGLGQANEYHRPMV